MFIFGPRTGQGQDHTSWRRHPLRPRGMAGGCSCIMTSLAGVGGGERSWERCGRAVTSGARSRILSPA